MRKLKKREIAKMVAQQMEGRHGLAFHPKAFRIVWPSGSVTTATIKEDAK